MAEIKGDILKYLSAHGKENKYRIASALKIDTLEVTEALDALGKEGKIEIESGKAVPIKEKSSRAEQGEIESGQEAEQEKMEELERWVRSSLTNIREAIEKSLRER